MNSKAQQLSQIDFEQYGHDTMQQIGDEAAVKDICALKIHALADELQPTVKELGEEHEDVGHKRRSLWGNLYDREFPVNDAVMLGEAIKALILAVLIVLTAIASMATHAAMFRLTGTWLSVSNILGITLTSLTTAIGYLTHEKILSWHKLAEAVVILAAFILCFWGLFDLAQARSKLLERLTTSRTPSTYVDENGTEDLNTQPERQAGATEETVRASIGTGQTKIMYAADLILGILVGRFVRLWTDHDFVSWHKLHTASRDMRRIGRRIDELTATVEIAKKLCMAGILRAKHRPRKRQVPYHRALPIIAFVLALIASPAFAQTIERHEAILIDVSGSIGKGGVNNELFRDYLTTVRKLLSTEPPQSRVWVSIITTDSFGSVRSILKGWTPEVHGVFDDDLNHARHELAASFEAKSASLRPVAAGTDIIGALWHAKTVLESGSKEETSLKTIWLLSDMLNESASLNMPALLPTGSDEMIAQAKRNGLIVPLRGYKVYVIGASPAGLSPEEWNAVRMFWTLYFRQTGAELVSYSAESGVER